jgi:Cu(I)/Ag(I) efflux system membrane protein CusA/SilA
VPRASVTQATDDLKSRDALLRRFPEMELIVGKAGRADTPTDPSPLDMVESIITLRPKEHWPKRKLKYKDAQKQTAVVLAGLQQRGLIDAIDDPADRRSLLDPATMNASTRMDETMRELVLQRYRDFEADLGMKLVREFVVELVDRWRKADRLLTPVSDVDIDQVATQLVPQFGQVLAAGPGQEDVNRLVQQIAETLAAEKKVELNPELITARFHPLYAAYLAVTNVLGVEQPTLFTELSSFLEHQRDQHWRAAVRQINFDIFGQAVAAYNRYAIEELHTLADEKGLWAEKPPAVAGLPPSAVAGLPTEPPAGPKVSEATGRPDGQTQRRGQETRAEREETRAEQDMAEQKQLLTLREELDAAWSPHLFLWRKSKDDLLKEVDSVVRMPGWANIWTQPIINRIDMLATGVRTMIGVKVFGNDLDKIQEVSEPVREPSPGRKDHAGGVSSRDPGDLHHSVSDLPRSDRCPTDDESRAGGSGRRHLPAVAVRLSFQRRRAGRVHRLLWNGDGNGHHHACVPAGRGGETWRPGENSFSPGTP